MMASKIIFLGIAWRAGRGVFERVGVWELFRVFRGNILVRRDAGPPSSRRAATRGRAILRHGPIISREAASSIREKSPNHGQQNHFLGSRGEPG